MPPSFGNVIIVVVRIFLNFGPLPQSQKTGYLGSPRNVSIAWGTRPGSPTNPASEAEAPEKFPVWEHASWPSGAYQHADPRI